MFEANAKFFMICLIVSLAIFMPGPQVKAQGQPLSMELPKIDFGPLNDIIEGIGEGIDNLFNTNPLDKLEGSECLASELSGTSGIKKEGYVIIGTNCDDKIKGNSYDEVIYSLGGEDQVFAGAGNDIIYGGLGDNMLYGEHGDDIIMPGGGTNLVDGGFGNDILFGGLGNNLLVGGDGTDQLIAGNGTAIMNGGPGTDYFDCGPNSVVLDYNPDDGDTITEKCKIVNNVRNGFPSDSS
jgi:Ca2+-binding RTX toxin-like protein